MKIAVTGNRRGWHFSQLERAAEASSIELVHFDLTQANVRISDDCTSAFFVHDHPVAEVDCILTRAMPPGSLQQIVFRMDWLHQVETQLRIPVINPAKTVEAAVDKYLSLEKIRNAGVRVPETSVSQNTEIAMSHFEQLSNDVLVKPIFGSQGRGIVRLVDADSAKQHFDSLIAADQVVYQQRFLEHEGDFRLLVIGETVHGMSRNRPGHWLTNASQGAICRPHVPSSEEILLAKISTHAVGALIAGVDVVYEGTTPYVVEINSSPAWQAISKVVDADIASEIIGLAEMAVGRSNKPNPRCASE